MALALRIPMRGYECKLLALRHALAKGYESPCGVMSVFEA